MPAQHPCSCITDIWTSGFDNLRTGTGPHLTYRTENSAERQIEHKLIPGWGIDAKLVKAQPLFGAPDPKEKSGHDRSS